MQEWMCAIWRPMWRNSISLSSFACWGLSQEREKESETRQKQALTDTSVGKPILVFVSWTCSNCCRRHGIHDTLLKK